MENEMVVENMGASEVGVRGFSKSGFRFLRGHIRRFRYLAVCKEDPYSRHEQFFYEQT